MGQIRSASISLSAAVANSTLTGERGGSDLLTNLYRLFNLVTNYKFIFL